jgi:hypothetical protein
LSLGPPRVEIMNARNDEVLIGVMRMLDGVLNQASR